LSVTYLFIIHFTFKIIANLPQPDSFHFNNLTASDSDLLCHITTTNAKAWLRIIASGRFKSLKIVLVNDSG
jgi:hypothetical protein